MIKFGLILLAALALAHTKNLKVEDSVQVQVYYETLCPDSIKFITKQLYPTFAVLTDYIKLEMVPYGKAAEINTNGTRDFICQHGVKECHGNKVHACAISLNTVESSTEFVFCSEQTDDPSDDENLQSCADIVGISWTDINECVTSGKGDDLLSENGKKTDLIQIKFVPTIVIDGVFSQENQDESLIFFKPLICDLLGFPDECKC